ncbi:MAG: nucleotidyltransferase [Deltaproteobacteria bacterium]|nr:nucleotidyltransferase [Deltaproteobacteria bacterium]
MPGTIDYLETVLDVSEDLEKRGMTPVLIGGMALVILGSDRITNDFDFLISAPETVLAEIVEVFYAHGFELVSKLKEGKVTRTIDNKNIAVVRLKLDAPQSAYFYHPKKELRIDLLFDFPFPAKEVAGRATKTKIKSRFLRVASTEDLIRLKEIAYKDRKAATDAQDLEFLRKKLG